MALSKEIQDRLLELPPEKQQEVLDFIAFLRMRLGESTKSPIESDRGERIKKLLIQLANLKTFEDIADPVEWQREVRQDALQLFDPLE